MTSKNKPTLVKFRATRMVGLSFDASMRRRVLDWSKYPPISTTHKAIAKQWHPTKNGPWTPDDFTKGSQEKVWWKCPAGADHVWCGSVIKRTSSSKTKFKGCPFCKGYRPSVTNSLKSLFPALTKQFHPTKNGALSPKNVVAKSSRLVWWQCPNGVDHTWKTRVSSRTAGGTGCPFCSYNKVSYTNCLKNSYPQVAAQWLTARNGNLSPLDVTCHSILVVWWQCDKGSDHRWQAAIDNRTTGGFGCPFCAGRAISKTNSFAINFPEVAKQWHPTKNQKRKPSDFTCGSQHRAWWKCSKGTDHEWETTISSRRDKNCPFCAGVKVSQTNSLATRFPQIAQEWNFEKNGNLRPTGVTYGSKKRVWWRCRKVPSHEWQTAVQTRTRTKSGCAVCDGKIVLPENSLATKYSARAKQWHRSKNGNLSPSDVLSGSHKIIWWQCDKVKTHVWQQAIRRRVCSPFNCPICEGYGPDRFHTDTQA